VRIAITGGICDGKSTVLAAIADAGYPTVSADDVLREQYADPSFLAKVADALGSEAVSGGELDRAWVRTRIIEDAKSRRKLNELTHEPALEIVLRRMREAGGKAFAEVPLLIEACAHPLFDRVVVVTAGAAEQRRRLAERLQGDEAMADRLLRLQLPTCAKIPFADAIVRTDRPRDAVLLGAVRLARDLA
jgi:dephospho-CoA kinase